MAGTNQQNQGQAEKRAEDKSELALGSSLSLLLERSADATLLIDDNKFVACNQAAVELLRLSNNQKFSRFIRQSYLLHFNRDGQIILREG